MSIFGNDNSNFQKSKARSITAGCLETAEWKYGSCSKRLGHEISPSVVSWIPARLFREEGDFVAHLCGFPSGEGWTSVTEFRVYLSAVQSRQHVYYFDYAACTQNLESWTPRDNDCFLPPRYRGLLPLCKHHSCMSCHREVHWNSSITFGLAIWQIAIDLQSKQPARLLRHRETSINLVGGRRKHLVSFYQTVQV